MGGRANIKPPLLVHHETDFNNFDFNTLSDKPTSQTQSQSDIDQSTPDLSGNDKQSKKGRKKRRRSISPNREMIDMMQERWKQRVLNRKLHFVRELQVFIYMRVPRTECSRMVVQDK